MKAWSLFYPDVLPELPAVPLPLLDHGLRAAAIEFCERSKAWRVTYASIDAVADQMGYAVPLAADTELVEIVGVWHAGESLVPRSPGYLEAIYADWTTEVGTPADYTQEDELAVLLVPAPDAAATATIKIRAAIKPGTAATGVDELVFTKWRKAITAGCKAAMMAMAGQPWSKPDLVPLYMAQFENAIDEAETGANSGFVRSRPRFSGSFC